MAERGATAMAGSEKYVAVSNGGGARPTLQQIAAAVGVSASAVSCALRRPDHPRVSAEMRERIQRVAGELGYQPNEVARAVLRGRQKLILLAGSLGGIESMPLAVGLSEGLAADGYSLGMVNLDANRPYIDAADDLWRRCAAQMAAGIVLTGMTAGQAEYLRVRITNLPLIFAAQDGEGVDAPVCEMDWDAACDQILTYAAKRGCKRCGIALSDDRPLSFRRRRDGFAAARARLGLAADGSLCLPLPYPSKTRAVTERLAAWLRETRLDAVFVADPELAARVGTLAGPRLRLIIGMDTNTSRYWISREGARLLVPAEAIGRRAAATLLAACEGNEPPPPSQAEAPVLHEYTGETP